MKEILYIKGSKGIKEILPLSKYGEPKSGGEADVYNMRDGRALKVFKGPDHPDVIGFQGEQDAARKKIDLMKTKLPEFLKITKSLPKRVVSPQDLATDEGGTILGYTMPFLEGADDLRSYSKNSYRKKTGLTNEKINESVLDIFRDLHHTVTEIHEADVVIGDINDTNVLVKGKKAHIIDADSFQFGKYRQVIFKPDFIDPKLLDLDRKGWAVRDGARQTPDTDWYAYDVLLIQSLLLMKPFDGIYDDPSPGNKDMINKRLEKRITIFNDNVKLPDSVIHYNTLSDDLIQHFEDVFVKDKRGEFPSYLLDMKWKKCGCGAEHGRNVCPKHTTGIPQKPFERGDVRAITVFKRDFGNILASAYEKNQLRYLYQENNEYRREDGDVILGYKLDSKHDFEVQGKKTIFRKTDINELYNYGLSLFQVSGDTNFRNKDAVFDPQDELKTFPTKDFKVNSDAMYSISHGKLWREDKSGNITSSDFLKGESEFWVGEDFGIVAEKTPKGIKPEFVFDARNLSIKQQISNTREMEGQMVDSDCYFDKDYSWLLISMKQGQDTKNYCRVIGRRGGEFSRWYTKAGDNNWLGNIHGKCAVGGSLLSPTDNGIEKVTLGLKRNELTTKRYPETAPFVNSRTRLLRGKDEVYAVNAQDIVRLEFKKKEEKIDSYFAEVPVDMLIQERARAAYEIVNKTYRFGDKREHAQKDLLALYVIKTDLKRNIELRYFSDSVTIPDKYRDLYTDDAGKFVEEKSITQLLKRKMEAEVRSGKINDTENDLLQITGVLNSKSIEIDLLANRLNYMTEPDNLLKEVLKHLPLDEANAKEKWLKDAIEFINKNKLTFIGYKELRRQEEEKAKELERQREESERQLKRQREEAEKEIERKRKEVVINNILENKIDSSQAKEVLQKELSRERMERWVNIPMNEATEKWKKLTDVNFLNKYKNDPNKAEGLNFMKRIFKKEGQEIDEVEVNADILYSTFFEGENKGDIDFFTKKIIDNNTIPEIERNKYLIMSLGSTYGETFGKVVFSYIQSAINLKGKELSSQVTKKLPESLDSRWSKIERGKKGFPGFRKEAEEIVLNKVKVNEDFGILLDAGPNAVIKDILMTGFGFSEPEISIVFQNQHLIDELQQEVAESLIGKRLQLSGITTPEMSRISYTAWGQSVIARTTEKGRNK